MLSVSFSLLCLYPVLEVDLTVNVSDRAYWLLMEQRFLDLYDEAFNVDITYSRRRRRAVTINNTTLQVGIPYIAVHAEYAKIFVLLDFILAI